MINGWSGGPLRLRPSSDDAEWDHLVVRHPDATAFHLSSFLRAAGSLLGLRPRLVVAEADGETVGVVPMLCRPTGPLVLVNHGLPFPYLGPLLPAEIPPVSVIGAVRAYLRPRAVAHFRMQSVTQFTAASPPGWELRDTWTAAVVDVGGKDDDALMAMISRSQRLKVKQALQRGLVAEPATREDLERLTPWVGETFARQRLPGRWSAGAHLTLYDALQSTGAAVASVVRRDDELLAVSMDLFLGRRLIGWEMGMSDAGRSAGASLVLHTANMRRARDMGADEFDMLGAPTPGIAHYKRSLGAELRPRGYAQWEPAWLPSRKHLRRASSLLGNRMVA
mgnify:CR=1 FL=1